MHLFWSIQRINFERQFFFGLFGFLMMMHFLCGVIFPHFYYKIGKRNWKYWNNNCVSNGCGGRVFFFSRSLNRCGFCKRGGTTTLCKYSIFIVCVTLAESTNTTQKVIPYYLLNFTAWCSRRRRDTQLFPIIKPIPIMVDS